VRRAPPASTPALCRTRQRARQCRIFTPAQPTDSAASLRDFRSGADSGLPAFGVVNWNGIAAPAATPREEVERLRSEIVKALAAPDMREFLDTMSAAPGGVGSAEFARLIQEETARWAPVAAAAAIEKQ
jgi:tripartite-type tricarboxylate transporter receptor subunit TctC